MNKKNYKKTEMKADKITNHSEDRLPVFLDDDVLRTNRASESNPALSKFNPEEVVTARPLVCMRFSRMDGPLSWFMCFGLVISCLIVYGCSSTYGILFPGILEDMRSGKAISAIPGSLSLANSGLLGPITGHFYDRFGCSRAMFFGGALSVIGLFSSSFAPTIAVLIVTLGIIFGFGFSLVFLSCLLVIPQYFQKYAFQATSLVSVGPGAALLVMSPIVQSLFQAFGWRKTMKITSALAFSPCILGIIMSVIKGRGTPPKRPEKAEQKHNENIASHGQKCNLKTMIHLSVFKNKVYVLTTFMITMTSLGHMMPFIHLAKYCKDMGIPTDHSSWIYFTIGLSSLLSRVVVGKFGNTGIMTLPHIYQMGAYTLAVGNLLLPTLKEFFLFILYGIMYGVGEGLVYTATMHMVMDSLPSRRKGVGYGIYVFFMSLAYATGSPFSGLVSDVTGSYSYSFYTAGSLQMVGASLQFLSPFLHKNDEDMKSDFEHVSCDNLLVIERETVL